MARTVGGGGGGSRSSGGIGGEGKWGDDGGSREEWRET